MMSLEYERNLAKGCSRAYAQLFVRKSPPGSRQRSAGSCTHRSSLHPASKARGLVGQRLALATVSQNQYRHTHEPGTELLIGPPAGKDHAAVNLNPRHTGSAVAQPTRTQRTRRTV